MTQSKSGDPHQTLSFVSTSPSCYYHFRMNNLDQLVQMCRDQPRFTPCDPLQGLSIQGM
jgi:hypothetical protein